MKKIIPLLFLLALIFHLPLQAADEVQNLTQIYDRYNALILAGQSAQAEQLRTKEKEPGLNIEIKPKNAAEKKKMEQFFKAMTPLRYTVENSQWSADGKKAELDLLADLQSPDNKISKSEITLNFIQENSQWKISKILFGVNPDQVKRSPDSQFEPEKNYNHDKDVNVGGRIIKTEFQKDYILVTLRVIDEEYLVFLPSKKELEKSKFDLQYLKPWKILSIQGMENLNNPLKIWALKIDAVPSEI